VKAERSLSHLETRFHMRESWAVNNREISTPQKLIIWRSTMDHG